MKKVLGLLAASAFALTGIVSIAPQANADVIAVDYDTKDRCSVKDKKKGIYYSALLKTTWTHRVSDDIWHGVRRSHSFLYNYRNGYPHNIDFYRTKSYIGKRAVTEWSKARFPTDDNNMTTQKINSIGRYHPTKPGIGYAVKVYFNTGSEILSCTAKTNSWRPQDA